MQDTWLNAVHHGTASVSSIVRDEAERKADSITVQMFKPMVAKIGTCEEDMTDACNLVEVPFAPSNHVDSRDCANARGHPLCAAAADGRPYSRVLL
jgi:hypothetical protein